ncbi:MAG: autotransporter outer membrane beta-barrel domain-containing protein [Stenotrophomonas maltophilia]
MRLSSVRNNALCLAVAAALAAVPAMADPLKYVYNDVDLEEVPWNTRWHIEIYDSRVNSTKDAWHSTDAAVTASQSSLIMERTRVSTRGREMGGVNVSGPGDSSILDSSVVTYGENATGIEASARQYLPEGGVTPYGAVAIKRTTVETFGLGSRGVTHALGGVMTLRDSRVATHGDASDAVSTHAGPMVMFGSEVFTTGAGSSGVHARSLWLVGMSGGRTAFNADVEMNAVSVETRGAESVGLVAYYQGNLHETIGTSFRLRASSVRSAQSHAVKFDGGDANSLSLSGGSVLDGGDAVLFSDRAGTVGRVDANDSTLIGRGGQAVVAGNGAVILLELANSDVIVEAGKGLAWAANGGRIDLQAKGSRLQGTAFADDTSRLDVALDGSRWDAWGRSQVDGVSLRNGSTLLLGAGSVGDQLIVRGDFTIDDSTLVFDSALHDDSSLTDMLWVQGDTNGSGDIMVNNVGGRGAQTVNGIQLIAVDGESNAGFALQGRAVGGVYEYFLHKGSKADPGDGGWYLRSELNDVPDPCSVEGECDPPPRPVPCSVDPGQGHCDPTVVEPPPPRPLPCSVDPGQSHCAPTVVEPPPVPVLRPETGAYLANQVTATQMFTAGASERRQEGGRGVWASIGGQQANYSVVGGQLRVQGNRSVLHLGTEVLAWGEESRGQLGVFAGSGRADNTVSSALTGYTAAGKVRGNAAGVYSSWQQRAGAKTGLRVDAALHHAQFRNTVQGQALAKERYDSRASTAAAELEYGFQIRADSRMAVFLAPNLQVRHSRYRADTLTERNGTVIEGTDGNGISTRLGLRAFADSNTETGRRVQPFVSAHWIRESGDNSLRFDGEKLAGGLPRDRYEFRGGAELQLSERWSARADLGWQRGLGYREVAGQVAMRASW